MVSIVITIVSESEDTFREAVPCLVGALWCVSQGGANLFSACPRAML